MNMGSIDVVEGRRLIVSRDVGQTRELEVVQHTGKLLINTSGVLKN